MSIQDREQDRFLGIEIVIQRTPGKLAGVGKLGDRTAHIALPREQAAGRRQDALIDSVVILGACSRHGNLSVHSLLRRESGRRLHLTPYYRYRPKAATSRKDHPPQPFPIPGSPL